MSRLRILLVVSVLVNLFAIGLIGGSLVAMHSGRQPFAAFRRGSGPALVAGGALPAADHDRFVAVMRDVLATNHALRLDARRSRREAAALLSAAVLDRAAVSAALDRARADDFALRQRLEESALAFAATLPPDERAAFAGPLARGGVVRHPLK